jgi:hypothetical protein
MEALIDDVNGVPLGMVFVVVDDDSYGKKVPTYPEHYQEEVNVHLNKSI